MRRIWCSLRNSLTFRFAEFVASLNGTEEVSGEIVRAGLIAAILSVLVWAGPSTTTGRG